MAFDTWESYFYPQPDEGTLRNLFDERDGRTLTLLEYVETMRRQRELSSGQVDVARTYDAEHVRAIHRHLLQDVYEWAGEFRSVNVSKGVGRGFGDVKTGEVDRLLDDVRTRVVGTDWSRLDREAFGEKAAVVFAYLNQAHPFREGNGRAAKVFMEHVAERSRFTLDYGQVSPEVWNQASQLSRPDMFAYDPEPASLVPVFRAIAQPRPNGPAGLPSTSPVRSVLRASYPQAATEATSQPPHTGPQTRRSGPYMLGRGSGHGMGE